MPWIQTNHGWSEGCFPLCQRFHKFRSQVKWKGSFRFLSTRIFGTTSRCGPLWPVHRFRPKFAFPFWQTGSLPSFSLLMLGIVKNHSCWWARFDRKMFHFSRAFPLITDRSVWHNEKHPKFTLRVKNCEELELTIHIKFWDRVLFKARFAVECKFQGVDREWIFQMVSLFCEIVATDRVLENLESPWILLWHVLGLESPERKLLFPESYGILE